MNKKNIENLSKGKNLTLKCFEILENVGLWILKKIHLKKLADFYTNHLEGMRYLICGGLSTVVNIAAYVLGSYAIFSNIGDEHLRVNLSEIFAFVIALIFAYWVNKKIVFNSSCKDIKDLLREIGSFTSCRIFTEIISIGMMNFAVIISLNDVIMKVIANIVVIILNFILSKLIIFKKEK